MARRKIILFVVEGPSDQAALEVVLENLFNSRQIKIFVYHGDLTTDLSVTVPQDAVKAARKTFLIQHETDGFKEKDIAKVVLLSDTDGCFIAEKHIEKDLNYPDKFFYEQDRIRSARIEDVKDRNKMKSIRMRTLSGKKKIADKPFEYYYMSCNLDHALYGKNNLTDQQKEEEADLFALTYGDDLEGFINDILMDLHPEDTNSYEQSWIYIQQGIHSLSRCTNLMWFLYQNKEDLEPKIKEKVVNWNDKLKEKTLHNDEVYQL